MNQYPASPYSPGGAPASPYSPRGISAQSSRPSTAPSPKSPGGGSVIQNTTLKTRKRRENWTGASPTLSIRNASFRKWLSAKAFHPYSEFRISLEAAYLLAGLYTWFATAFLVSFRQHPAPTILLVGSGLADATFIADAVTSSVTGFKKHYRTGKVLIRALVPSFLHYAKRWMALDVIVSLPIVLFQFSTWNEDAQPSSSLQSLFYALQILKLGCTIRMRVYFVRLQRRNPGRHMEVAMVIAGICFLLVAHWLACLRFASATTASRAYTVAPEILPPKDMDECTEDTHDCAFEANCTNTDGSFTCSCQYGFWGNGTECTTCYYQDTFYARMSCFANPLLAQAAWDAAQNKDVDECAENLHNCDPLANCTNTDGSYTCECVFGFQGDGFRCFSCSDHDGVLNYMTYTEQYGCAFYWTVQTVLRIGYGDVSAQSHEERVFSIFTITVTLCLIAYALSVGNAVACSLNSHYRAFLRSRRRMLQYMHDRSLPLDMQEDSAAVADESWSNHRGAPGADLDLIRALPRGIRLRVFRRLYADIFNSVSFFGNKDRDLVFWHYLLSHLQLKHVLPGDQLLGLGDEETQLCLLRAGKVVEVDASNHIVQTHTRPSHWGEGALLRAVSPSTRRVSPVAIRASTSAEVFVLDIAALHALMQADDTVAERVRAFMHWELERFVANRFRQLARRLQDRHIREAQAFFRQSQMVLGAGARPRAGGRLR